MENATYTAAFELDGKRKVEEVIIQVEDTTTDNDVRKLITNVLLARYHNNADYLFSLSYSIKT